MTFDRLLGVTKEGKVVCYRRKRSRKTTSSISGPKPWTLIKVPFDMADYLGVVSGEDGNPRLAFRCFDLGFKKVARIVTADNNVDSRKGFPFQGDIMEPENTLGLVNFVRTSYAPGLPALSQKSYAEGIQDSAGIPEGVRK